MPWADEGRLHILGQWPGKVLIANKRQYWEWPYVFSNLGYEGAYARFWNRKKTQVQHLIDDFSLDASTDILRGKRFYESQEATRSQAADAPRVDLITTRFLWSALVDTMYYGRRQRKIAVEAYFTFLLNKVCRNAVKLPLVFTNSDGTFGHVTLTLNAADNLGPAGLDMSPVFDREDCPFLKLLNCQEIKERVPLLRVLTALRDSTRVGTTLRGTLYCMLDPLVRMTETWVAATALPVTAISTASQLMPRPIVRQRRRNLDPDTKKFLGWTIYKARIARVHSAFVKAHEGAPWGPPTSHCGHERALVNTVYANSLAKRMGGLNIIALSIDEVTLDGCSHFVSIITDPQTKTTGYGSIQVWLG